MKNIKYIMLGVLISFIIFFVIGAIYSNINRNNKIHINEYTGFEETKNNFNKRIDAIKNETCRSSLKYMLNRVEENASLKGDVSLKDYYESFYKDDLTIIEFYSYVMSSCNLEKNTKTYNMALSSLIYPEYIKNKYERSYEFNFKNYLYKDTKIDEMGTYTTIINELSTISLILEELS